MSYAFDAAHAAALGFDLRVLDGDWSTARVHGIGVNMVTGRVTACGKIWARLSRKIPIPSSELRKSSAQRMATTLSATTKPMRLTGGAGADNMAEEAKTTPYYVDSESDYIREESGPAGGVDTVVSSISYSLHANSTTSKT